MAITAAYENSAVISTSEISLPNVMIYTSASGITTDGVYQCFLDLNALAAGDQFEMKVYEKVQAAGTQRAVGTFTFTGVQPDPHAVFPSMILLHGWDMTLKRLAGSDRTIAWSIRQVA